jgi:predicted membrane channel-forming protein YqfA (hemolysin III family)
MRHKKKQSKTMTGVFCRSQNEEIANSLTHLGAAILSLFFLLTQPTRHSVFFFFSFITFFASYQYHAADDIWIKLSRRQRDIASIFWLIPATIYDMIPTSIGIIFLCVCFTLSIPVIISWVADLYTDIALILLSAAAIFLATIFCKEDLTYLLAGFFVCAAGLIFYFKSERPWMHTVWHICVCIGWALHAWSKVH